MHFLGSAIGVTFGIGLSAAVLPAALSVLGFTKAGIAAGSLAAKMMSATAVSNGGAVAPGSFVAIAQSLGAAGLPTAVKTTVTAICAAIGAAVL